MNTIPSNQNPNIINHNAGEPDSLAFQPWITPDDLVGDIDRLIGILVMPYISDANPFLHRDELQAECWAKFAAILCAGHLNRCPTRAKAFAFVKVVLRNYVMSLVQKYAYTEKRTGVKPPPKQRRSSNRWNNQEVSKTIITSLDDEDQGVQVGGNDPSFSRMEFLEELSQMLTEEERLVVDHLIRNECPGRDNIPLPLPEIRFKLVLAGIRAKGRFIRDRAG